MKRRTKDELRLLKKLYPVKTKGELAGMFGCPVHVIAYRTSEFAITKVYPWSAANNKLLTKLFYREPIEQIAEKLGRTVWATRKQANRLGLNKRHMRHWSADELKLLKKLWPLKSKLFPVRRSGTG